MFALPMLLTSTSSMRTLNWLLVILKILNLTNGINETNNLQIVKQWKALAYNIPTNVLATDKNFYNPENVFITGITIGEDRIFIATARLFSGVPTTLSQVPKADFGDSPVLQAYPDWTFSTSVRKNFNCNDLILVSVFRMRIDSCNRLWVLDAGVSRSLEDYEFTCPPKILVFDLKTNQVVRRIDFPRDVLRPKTLFSNLIVDETTSKAGTCNDVFVYISDTAEPAIVVYDGGQNQTWRLTHLSMFPDPDYGQTDIVGRRFILMDGVIGLTFDQKNGIIYYQPLATDRMFSVTKQVLRNGPLPLNQILDVKLVGRKSSQGMALDLSSIDGSLLFSPMSETVIVSWNPTTNKQAVLALSPEQLQFVSDIETPRFDPGVIYLISSKFQRFIRKDVDLNEINNRILRIEFSGNMTNARSTPLLAKPQSGQSSVQRRSPLQYFSTSMPVKVSPSKK